MKKGEGSYTFTGGSSYEGSFEDGMMHGRGNFIFENGDRYEGMFLKNQKDGQGRYIFKEEGRLSLGSSKSRENYFEGCYKNGIRNGEGVLCDTDKQVKGKWKNGVLLFSIDQLKIVMVE